MLRYGFAAFLIIIYYVGVNFLSPVFASNALKDAPKPPRGQKPEADTVGDWAILRQRLTWTEGMSLCQTMYVRLATLQTAEQAKALIDGIADMSEKFTEAYDKKYKEVEYGMDRRYWIGLTDLSENGKWIWAQTKEGDVLDYDMWYPGQPDHVNKTEHCVTLWNPAYFAGDKHSFNDEDCSRKHYAICDTKEDP